MSKKHFIALAEEFRVILAELEGPEARAGVIKAVEGSMRAARSVNGRFDKARFLMACGL